MSNVHSSIGSKKLALTWLESFHLGDRVGFCVCPCQRGTLVVLWGPPLFFMLQLKLTYCQAPGEGPVSMAEPIGTGHPPGRSDWLRACDLSETRRGFEISSLQLWGKDPHGIL